MDPFEIGEGWFALELVEFQVVPGRDLPADVRARVVETIATLGLSDSVCCAARAEYAEAYWREDISLRHLRRRAPFVAKELERHGMLKKSSGADGLRA